MVKCVFCGREEPAYIGMHYIKNDGSVNYFCSSKCRKNTIKLKRERRKIKWTQAFREVREVAKVKAEKLKKSNAPMKKDEEAEEHEHARQEQHNHEHSDGQTHGHLHSSSEVKIDHSNVKHEHSEKKEVKAKKTAK
jgi:large subunit ribosomal protein L24e